MTIGFALRMTIGFALRMTLAAPEKLFLPGSVRRYVREGLIANDCSFVPKRGGATRKRFFSQERRPVVSVQNKGSERNPARR